MPAVTRLAGWKYKEGTTDEQKRLARDSLQRLYTELAHLVNHGPIGGKNISKSGAHKDLDLAFTVEFKSIEARNEFDPHPLHNEMIVQCLLLNDGVLQPFVADLFVFDLVKDEYE